MNREPASVMSQTGAGVTEALAHIGRGAGFLFGGLVVARGAGYLFHVMVARLGTENYGLFALGITVLSIASTFAVMGLGSGLRRYVPFYRGQQNDAAVRGVLKAGISISLGGSLAVGALCFYLAPILGKELFRSPDLVPVLRFVAVLLPFFVLHSIFNKSLTSLKAVRERVLAFIIAPNVGKLILTALFLLLGFRLWAALLGYGLAILLSAGFAFYLLERRVYPFFWGESSTRENVAELFVFSFPLLLSGITAMALTWVDSIMLGAMLTVSAVGVYAAAVIAASLIYIGSEILMPIFLPTMTEYFARSDDSAVAEVYESVSRWLLGITIPCCLGLALLARPLLVLIFGQPYAGAAAALVILALAKGVFVMSSPSSAVLRMVKKTGTIFFITLTTSVANIVLNALFIPRYGLVGAATATGTSLVLFAGLTMFSASRAYSITLVSPGAAKILVAGAASLSGALAAKWLGANPVVLAFIMLGTYLAFVGLLNPFESQDRELGNRAFRKLGALLAFRSSSQ